MWSPCLMVTSLESKRKLMKMYSMKIWAVSEGVTKLTEFLKSIYEKDSLSDGFKK